MNATTSGVVAFAVLIACGLLGARSAAAADPPADVPAIRCYGAKVLAITFGDGFDVAVGMKPDAYRVRDAGGKAIGVTAVGRDSKVVRLIPRGWPYKPVMQHTVFLVLAEPLASHRACTVAVGEGVAGRPLTLRCRLDSKAPAPELVKVNQCGYRPDAPRKLAYLGGWLGSLGPLGLDHLDGGFRVIATATGKTAYKGTAVLSRREDPDSGENVYHLDFSGLREPGTYVIEVDGIGRSYPFRIADDVLGPALVTVARGLYHQRCGTALTEPYTRFTHPPCHRGKAKLVDYHHSMDGEWMKKLPDHVVPEGTLIDGWGGWHDAGDYDRLGSRHIVTVNDLLAAYDANPGAFADRQLNIPESGNGIPDILDEAKWGLDWFERMYDPADGGFYYRIETPNYGHAAPHKDKQQLYCMAKYPYYSCLTGVPFARAARICRPFDAQLADRYLRIARAALAFGQKKVREPKADGRLRRAIPAVAAEIYCATGDADCHKLFLASGHRNVWSYARCTRDDVDARAKAAARASFIEPAEKVLARLKEDGYRTCLAGGRGGDQVMWDAATLMRGFAFGGRADFRAAAMRCLDHHLGANPLGYSWITGVGRRYPRHILQHPSEYDDIDEPVPGIPIFGPRALSPEKGSTHGKVFAKNLFPPAEKYPYLRFYAELPPVVPFSEFTTHSQSTAVFAYSFFVPAADPGR